MEQPDLSISTDIPTAVPRQSTESPTDSTSAESSRSHSFDHLAHSVPSLRFPRPLGNRQLTNWVSTSSPDIMQPETLLDDEPSLAELGYDVIGTDGESQAESIASSFDYQKPDDVQSLAGTDTGTDVDVNEVDTESSDDEEEEEAPTLANTAESPSISSTLVERGDTTDNEDIDVDTLLNRSLENPTDFSQHGLPSLMFMGQKDLGHTKEFLTQRQKLPSQDVNLGKGDTALKRNRFAYYNSESYRLALRYARGSRRVLIVLSGLAILYSLAIAGKHLLFTPPTPKVLSTVPVASVSSAAVPSSVRQIVPSSASTPTMTSSNTQKALQTGTSPSSLSFIAFGKDKSQAGLASQPQQQSICSAELYDRNEIMVKIPQTHKSTWLARDAILIAVSRGLYDIPTKVSLVEEGFLIEVPLEEAHDVLAVSIATTSRPKIKETFHVDFGRNKFIGALDAGKQLVKGFAQRLVDTVNETTAWVEETYIPALDVMSKQVCSQTSSVSDSLIQGLREVGKAALVHPTRLTNQVLARVKESFDSDDLARRQQEAQVQLGRGAQNVRDDLALRYLSAQLRSKLLWLRLQGKTEEYERYLSKAEAYLKDRTEDAEMAKHERAKPIKGQARSKRNQEHSETRRSLWSKAKRAPRA
ncbi:uncharacterized protein GGS25DRAFT_104224 [Hypoxylon fragiforme]|uniref:uncharacterized protein n=1 Tax=Hypoxylon fragiforme TaxID=63214 RepID=UPI0020C64C89|nr:uncharacterized protein GGS25DRAFT_104224 [Hypoxylon fragiforme]KAI2612058.1 hypothetical protein GGS25DRAFT_104224 [Hypoxylon fragiforme]